jgi:uncharacterized membrane protein YqiK
MTRNVNNFAGGFPAGDDDDDEFFDDELCRRVDEIASQAYTQAQPTFVEPNPPKRPRLDSDSDARLREKEAELKLWQEKFKALQETEKHLRVQLSEEKNAKERMKVEHAREKRETEARFREEVDKLNSELNFKVITSNHRS